MKRVAIIGAAGLLGQYLVQEALERGHEVLGTYRDTAIGANGLLTEHVDITDPREVDQVLSGFKPEIVILPSAQTNVDYCETHLSDAQRVNAEGTKNVASVCRSIGSALMYISTDYVFDGQKARKYSEVDAPNPQSVYARTKLEGERIALAANPHNSVCRLSVLYGWNKVSPKSNFVTWVVDSMRRGKEINLFGDQYVSPTYAPHCAQILMKMAEKEASGLYHTSGPDCLDRYTMGLMVAEVFHLDSRLCHKVKLEDVSLPAKRCKNSCLDISKVERDFHLTILPTLQCLQDMHANEQG